MVDSVAEINRPTKIINRADKKLAQFYNILKQWSFLECQNSLWQTNHEMIHFQGFFSPKINIIALDPIEAHYFCSKL